VLIGLCLSALGAGLWWRESAVVGLAAIIFGEEMLESGVFLAALRNDIALRSARTLEPALDLKCVLPGSNPSCLRRQASRRGVGGLIGSDGFLPSQE
jgi:hypothetical protein